MLSRVREYLDAASEEIVLPKKIQHYIWAIVPQDDLHDNFGFRFDPTSKIPHINKKTYLLKEKQDMRNAHSMYLLTQYIRYAAMLHDTMSYENPDSINYLKVWWIMFDRIIVHQSMVVPPADKNRCEYVRSVLKSVVVDLQKLHHLGKPHFLEEFARCRAPMDGAAFLRFLERETFECSTCGSQKCD